MSKAKTRVTLEAEALTIIHPSLRVDFMMVIKSATDELLMQIINEG